MKNPYEAMSDKDLSQVVDSVVKDKEKGVRAESLVPYAREIFENLNLDVDNPTVTLRECLDMAYYDLIMTVMKRYVSNTNELEHFRSLEVEKEVIEEDWNPALCPNCKESLSESLGDGYYTRPSFMERCPNCHQKLHWK